MTIANAFIGLSLIMVLSFQKINKEDERRYVSGVVVDKQTSQPLPDIYVYVIKGEEEAVTNQQGKFSFATWHESNLVLYLKRPNHDEVQIKLNDPKRTVLIRL